MPLEQLLVPERWVEPVCGIDPARFIQFCEECFIPAKDDLTGNSSGEILVPCKLFLPQIYLFREILKGLRDDIHLFLVLKCRQSGTTTLGLLLILYWCYRHPGMVFTMINPDDDLKAYNRNLLSDIVKDLAAKPEWCVEKKDDNRAILSFVNRSKIVWLNAGSEDLGRGIGAIGAHGTELGKWKNPDGVRSWFASLSQDHPSRFFLLEGTAKGPGLFKDYWMEYAVEEIGGKSIFIGWWLHPKYNLDLSKGQHQKIYAAYWEALPRLTREEDVWVKVVKERYNYDVSSTQIAWWRYKQKKEYLGNLAMLYQEYPPLHEYAWAYGAKGYVSNASVLVQKSRVAEARSKAKYFKYEYGITFDDVKFSPVDPKSDLYDLILWEEPVPDNPLVRYIISLDPSFGANEKSDLAVVEIFRAYSDSCVQVGEFAMRDVPSYALAWVILELAGIYHSDTRVCIELQGGGYAVNDELQRLERELSIGYSPKLVRYMDKLQHYLYFRPDGVRRVSATYHWITQGRSRDVMLARYRDHWERGILDIRSPHLLKETTDAIRNAEGEVKLALEDNRVMSAALGVMAYLQTLEFDIGQNPQFSRKESDEREKKVETTEAPKNLLDFRVGEWKKALLEKMAEEKDSLQAIQDKIDDGDWRQDYNIDSNRRYLP